MAGPISFDELFGPTGPGRAELDELGKSVATLSRYVKVLGKNLESDGQRIGAGLQAITTGTQALRQQAEQLNTTSEAERASLARLSAEVNKLAKEQQDYQAALRGQASIRQAATNADKEATAALRALQKELKEAYAANDAERITKAALAVQQYKRDTDQLSKAIRGANSEFTAVAGSYNRLRIETEKLGDKIRALPGGFDATNEAAARMKKEFFDNTQKLKDFDRELNQNFREVGSYARGIIEATTALNHKREALTREVQALKMQANASHISAEENRKLRAEIDRTEAELRSITGELNKYGAAARNGGAASNSFISGAAGMGQSLVTSFLGVTALIGALGQTFESVAEYSDQIADVRKTTQLSADATDQLTESLKALNTRTTLAGLLDIAKVGGQLGIAGKDIGDFTREVDVAVQALEDDFQGGAEQIATEIGKIGTVFRKELGDDVPDNIRRIGSAVNELGASGAATAPFLTDVALRTGAVASNAELGLKDVLAYAAVLQETGFNAEVSGTSLNRLFNTLSTRSEESFKIAKLADSNLTLKEFKRLVNNDFQGAITLFLRGLREGGTSTTRFNSLLGTLKLQSGEAKSVITTLAKNVDLLAEKQAIANEQLEQGTSLAAEAAIKNDNLAGSWAKLKNDVSNFFTSGAGAASLKWLVDGARASLNFSKGFGAIPRLVGLSKPPIADLGEGLATSALKARQFADGTDALMARFTRLNSITQRTDAEQQQLRETVLQLKDRLGETAVVLNRQTGQYDLNTAAVARNTKANRDKFTEDATNLAKRLKGFEEEREAAAALASALQEEASIRERSLTAATGLQGQADILRVMRVQAEKASNPALYGAPDDRVTPEVVQTYKEYLDLTTRSAAATDKAVFSEKKRDEVLRQLARLGLDAEGAFALLTQSTKDQTEKVDDSVKADKKKKQSVADVLHAEFELQKFRLEQKAADYDRQAGNDANSDEVRTRAVQKAAETRRQIAALEEQEELRQAAVRNAKLVNGDKALRVERQHIHEQFLAKIKALNISSDAALLALTHETAAQLAEVDKQVLDEEAQALERIGEDENRSAEERQQALLDASAKRIEIVLIESAIKRNAAKGDAEVLKQIQAQEDAAIAEQLRKTRNPNADLSNSDLDKRYTEQQTKLENARALGLYTERGYQRAVFGLETQYLRDKLTNLDKDVTKQREAAALRLEIKRRENQQAEDLDREAAQKREDILRTSLEQTQAFSDIFFQYGNDRRAEELANLQHSKEQELSVAGENAELRQQIEENYRRRELAARRKQAEYDKAQALFNVALNTAQAVTSVLSTGGGTRYADFGVSAGVLAALVIAQGVAQAVAIAAKPLPTYYKGRESGPAEYALVAERGPELVGHESRGFRLVAQEGIQRLEAGDKVYTAGRTEQLLQENDLINGRLVARKEHADMERQTTALRVHSAGRSSSREAAEARAAYQASRIDADRIVDAILSRPEQRLTEDGLRTWTRKDNTWVEEMNSRYHERG